MQAHDILPHIQRTMWSSQVDRRMFEGQKAEEEKRFLDFVGKRLFADIPKDLQETRSQMLQYAREVDALKTEGGVKKDGVLAQIGETYTPGEASAEEIVGVIGRWCDKTAGVLKEKAFPDSNPKFKPVTTPVLAEAVEHYVLRELHELSEGNEQLGLSFFMMMPDMMNLDLRGNLSRDYLSTLTHMRLISRAAFHNLANLDSIRPAIEKMPFLEMVDVMSIDPNMICSASNNLVALTDQPEFTALIETMDRKLHASLHEDRIGIAVKVVERLAGVDNPEMRRELMVETRGRIGSGDLAGAYRNLEEKSKYDLSTYRLLAYDRHGRPTGQLNPKYPGVSELDDERRKILHTVVMEMRGVKGHNDRMIDPLIKILQTHRNSTGDLSKLAWAYSSYLVSTRDAYPSALEGMESESLEVKTGYLTLLQKMNETLLTIPPAEAGQLKARIRQEKGEPRKLAVINEADQKLSKRVDEMLR